MLGRQVTVALRRPLQARLRSTTTAPQTQYTLAIRTFSHAPRLLDQSGRPVGRPRKAVGEPSRPVKRAVKSAAKKPALPREDAAAQKVAEKARIAKEKAAAKTKASKEREKASRERRKQQAAALKAKAKARAQVKAKTPEQLEKKKTALLARENKELKKTALSPPAANVPVSAWMMFSREKGDELKAAMKDASDRDARGAVLVQHTRHLAAQYKELSAGEIEHLNHLAHTYKDTKLAEFKSWVESHSVEEISLANAARRTLRRRFPSKQGKRVHKWHEIHDERQPKAPATPWIMFSVSRHASGDFKNIQLAERVKLIAQEWKALSEDEKAKYVNLYKQDHERYLSEKGSVSESSDASAA